METRSSKLIVNKSGGSAGAGGVTFRATLPTTWIREMGLGENNRNLILEFKEDVIVIKKDEIFLVVTEDGEIIYDIEKENLKETDNAIYESDINKLVEIEMDDCIHLDEKEDYETELDFYISNAIREDFATYTIETQLENYELTDEAKQIIQDEVIERIKARFK